MRRQQLSETQIAALFDPTTDPRELVRHYTLSEADITRNCQRCIFPPLGAHTPAPRSLGSARSAPGLVSAAASTEWFG
jgi:hypothetical protein